MINILSPSGVWDSDEPTVSPTIDTTFPHQLTPRSPSNTKTSLAFPLSTPYYYYCELAH